MAFTLVGLALLAFAKPTRSFCVSVAVIGIGSAVFHPEASRVARAASGGRHGFAQSFFQVGGNFGQSTGPLLAAFVVVPFGQHSVLAFTVLALIAVILLIGVSRWYGAHRTQRRHVEPSPGPLIRAPVVLRTIAVLIIMLFSKVLYLASIGSYYTFYLIGAFGVSVQSAQVMLFVFLASVAAGTFLGGPLADRFGAKFVIWGSILGVLPFTLLLPHLGLIGTVINSIAIGLVISSAFSAIVVYAQELTPGNVGAVAGLFFGLSFGLGGIGAAMLGAIADRTSIGFVYQICAFLPAIGLLGALLPNPRPARPAAAASRRGRRRSAPNSTAIDANQTGTGAICPGDELGFAAAPHCRREWMSMRMNVHSHGSRMSLAPLPSSAAPPSRPAGAHPRGGRARLRRARLPRGDHAACRRGGRHERRQPLPLLSLQGSDRRGPVRARPGGAGRELWPRLPTAGHLRRLRCAGLREHFGSPRRAEKARLIVEIWAEAGRNPAVAEISRAIDADVLGRIERLDRCSPRRPARRRRRSIRRVRAVRFHLCRRPLQADGDRARFRREAETARASACSRRCSPGRFGQTARGVTMTRCPAALPRSSSSLSPPALGALRRFSPVRAPIQKARALGLPVGAPDCAARARRPRRRPRRRRPPSPSRRPTRREFVDRLFVSGTLVPREEAQVAARIDGLSIVELDAEDGDWCKSGQVLARLDRTQLDALLAENDAAIKRADAAIEQARAPDRPVAGAARPMDDAPTTTARRSSAAGVMSRLDHPAARDGAEDRRRLNSPRPTTR